MTCFTLERDTFRRIKVFVKRKAQKPNVVGGGLLNWMGWALTHGNSSATGV